MVGQSGRFRSGTCTSSQIAAPNMVISCHTARIYMSPIVCKGDADAGLKRALISILTALAALLKEYVNCNLALNEKIDGTCNALCSCCCDTYSVVPAVIWYDT